MRAPSAVSLVLVLAVAIAHGLAHAQPSAGVKVDAKALLAELQRGGLVVFFRHTKTLPEHAHEARVRAAGNLDLAKCETQRNLSEAGVLEAKRQAEFVRRLRIPVGKVYSSRYCRAYQHAAHFTTDYEFSDPVTPTRNPDKAAALRVMLDAPPTPGANTFIFAHGGILWQATDYDSVESETFVFRPVPGGRAQLVAAIRVEEWDDLVAGRPCCAPRSFWRGKDAPPE
jgi:hypothetical protein